ADEAILGEIGRRNHNLVVMGVGRGRVRDYSLAIPLRRCSRNRAFRGCSNGADSGADVTPPPPPPFFPFHRSATGGICCFLENLSGRCGPRRRDCHTNPSALSSAT